MKRATVKHARQAALAIAVMLAVAGSAQSQQADASRKPPPSSYMPVVEPDFATTMQRMSKAKPGVMQRQKNLLQERYDLADKPAKGVTMSRGKPVQEGVRVKLKSGTSWEQLAGMSPDDIKSKDLFPSGFLPLPHPNHPEGGMLFPHFEIERVKQQDNRDLTRFDLDFDLPEIGRAHV